MSFGERTACAECDLIVRIEELRSGQRAACPRCGHLLNAAAPDGLTRSLVYALAALVLARGFRVHAPGLLLLGASLSGCFSIGPHTVPRDRFNYTAAIARSRNEQMLMNIVRLRYFQLPGFLTVSSVIAGYTYQGGIGVKGEAGTESFTDSFVGGDANLDYIERPTITYTPLAGEQFSKRMLQPIPIDVLFSLGQGGWSPEILLRVAYQRIGKVENMGFAPTSLEGARGFRAEAEKLERYDRVVELLLKLNARGAFEVVRPPDELPTLRFARNLPPELDALADELKARLGLDPGLHSFRVTDQVTARSREEILIQPRSLLAMLSFLARAVELPEEDALSNRALVLPPDVQQVVLERGPLRIRSQKGRPEDPYAAVRYRGHWFYVDGGDHLSQRTFATTLILFELQAPSGAGAAPLLTLPTR